MKNIYIYINRWNPIYLYRHYTSIYPCHEFLKNKILFAQSVFSLRSIQSSSLILLLIKIIIIIISLTLSFSKFPLTFPFFELWIEMKNYRHDLSAFIYNVIDSYRERHLARRSGYVTHLNAIIYRSVKIEWSRFVLYIKRADRQICEPETRIRCSN